MSEFKGTPGVWTASDYEESTATSVISSESGDILCVVGTCMTSAEEDYANANLIAAAPELLEALQQLVYADCHSVRNSTVHIAALEKASAAIAKALGQ